MCDEGLSEVKKKFDLLDSRWLTYCPCISLCTYYSYSNHNTFPCHSMLPQSNLTGLELARSKLFFFKHNDMEDCEVNGCASEKTLRMIFV